MIYFANPSTGPVRGEMTAGRLGCIVTPAQGNKLPASSLCCVDNGCGPGKNGVTGAGYPGPEAYLGLLGDLANELDIDVTDPDSSRCCFAVAPDVLCDAAATLRRSERMLD